MLLYLSFKCTLSTPHLGYFSFTCACHLHLIIFKIYDCESIQPSNSTPAQILFRVNIIIIFIYIYCIKNIPAYIMMSSLHYQITPNSLFSNNVYLCFIHFFPTFSLQPWLKVSNPKRCSFEKKKTYFFLLFPLLNSMNL